jgi:hypothetical protein
MFDRSIYLPKRNDFQSGFADVAPCQLAYVTPHQPRGRKIEFMIVQGDSLDLIKIEVFF